MDMKSTLKLNKKSNEFIVNNSIATAQSLYEPMSCHCQNVPNTSDCKVFSVRKRGNSELNIFVGKKTVVTAKLKQQNSKVQTMHLCFSFQWC